MTDRRQEEAFVLIGTYFTVDKKKVCSGRMYLHVRDLSESVPRAHGHDNPSMLVREHGEGRWSLFEGK